VIVEKCQLTFMICELEPLRLCLAVQATYRVLYVGW